MEKIKKTKKQKLSLKEKIFQVHDRTFRSVMQNLDVAKDFLGSYLPAFFKEQINLNDLRPESGIHINSDLKLLATDVLFSASLKNALEERVFILIEHLSNPVRKIPFRIPEYKMIISENYKGDKKGDKYPFVFALLFYHGKPYNYPILLEEAYEDAHQELAKMYPLEHIHVVDLNKIPDEEIKTHKVSGILELIFKHSRDGKILQVLEEIRPKIVELQSRFKNHFKDYIAGLLKYVLEMLEGKKRKLTREEITRNFLIEGENIMISVADVLREEGHQKGWQEGRQEGRQEGQQKGRQEGLKEGKIRAKMEIAKALLRKKIDLKDIQEVTGLSLFKLKELMQDR